jgi:hypothetical protein
MSDHETDVPSAGGTPAVPNWERNRPWIVSLTSHWLSWFSLVLCITAISTWLFVLPFALWDHIETLKGH